MHYKLFPSIWLEIIFKQISKPQSSFQNVLIQKRKYLKLINLKFWELH